MACTRRLNNARCCCLLRSTHASATTRHFSLWPGTARERTRRLKRLCSKQLARLEAATAAIEYGFQLSAGGSEPTTRRGSDFAHGFRRAHREADVERRFCIGLLRADFVAEVPKP